MVLWTAKCPESGKKLQKNVRQCFQFDGLYLLFGRLLISSGAHIFHCNAFVADCDFHKDFERCIFD